MSDMGGRLVFVAFVCLVGAAVAHAGDAKKARMHFDQGTTLYDLQKYDEAAKEYELAFAEKNDPALLFNIGQAYRFGGNYAKAIGAFRSFLRRLPDSENRAEVEGRIGEMQRLLADQRRSQDKPPAGITTIEKTDKPLETPSAVESAPSAGVAPDTRASSVEGTTPRPSRGLRYGGIATLAVGLAALASGAGLYAESVSAYDQINSPAPGYTFDAGTESRMKTFEGAGIALLVVGGAAAACGAVLTAIGFKKPSSSRALVAPIRGGAFASVAIDF